MEVPVVDRLVPQMVQHWAAQSVELMGLLTDSCWEEQTEKHSVVQLVVQMATLKGF